MSGPRVTCPVVIDPFCQAKVCQLFPIQSCLSSIPRTHQGSTFGSLEAFKFKMAQSMTQMQSSFTGLSIARQSLRPRQAIQVAMELLTCPWLTMQLEGSRCLRMHAGCSAHHSPCCDHPAKPSLRAGKTCTLELQPVRFTPSRRQCQLLVSQAH